VRDITVVSRAPCGSAAARLQRDPRDRIERAERLVEEQQLRLRRECTRDADALALTPES